MKHRKRMTVSAYCFGVFIIAIFAFFYPDYNRTPIHTSVTEFNEGWFLDDREAHLPLADVEVFSITNTLPQLCDNNILVLICRFDDAEVLIENERIFKSQEPAVLGVSTNAGNKEILVPLNREYSGKSVTFNANLQSSLYGTSFCRAYITTLSDYGLHLFLNNYFELIVSILLLFTGVVECIIASGFIINGIKVRKEFTFEALLYAGMFSIATSIWVFNFTRIPGIICGNMQSSSIIGYMAFLLMPLAFAEMIRAMEGKKNKFMSAVVYSEAALNIVLAGLIFAGVLQWNQTTIFCHMMDFADIIMAIWMTINCLRNGDSYLERKIMAIGTGLFVTICLVDITVYIINREGNFIKIFLIALSVFLLTHILIIFNRTGLRAKEEADYKEVKKYAFSDELTRLGNRRLFWNALNEYKQKPFAPDVTIVYMDVNRLKYYNDNFGHEAGDELISGAAECILAAFPDSEIVCRIGGDEFALILESSEENLKKSLEHFMHISSIWEGKLSQELHVAVGYAAARDYPNLTIPKLTKIADENMLKDKKKFYESTGYDRRGEARE